MIGEERFDERQLIVRGRVGFQTTVLTFILLMISALFADRIASYVDMGDYFIFLAQIILGYVSVNLLIHDAYMGIYENDKVNVLMIALLCLFFLMIGLFIFDMIMGENIFSGDHLMGYGSVLFSGSISITYFINIKKKK